VFPSETTVSSPKRIDVTGGSQNPEKVDPSRIPIQPKPLPDQQPVTKPEPTKVVAKRDSDTAALAVLAGVGVVLLGGVLWWMTSEKEK